jgi:hypothetical protein
VNVPTHYCNVDHHSSTGGLVGPGGPRGTLTGWRVGMIFRAILGSVFGGVGRICWKHRRMSNHDRSRRVPGGDVLKKNSGRNGDRVSGEMMMTGNVKNVNVESREGEQ